MWLHKALSVEYFSLEQPGQVIVFATVQRAKNCGQDPS
jgi:hypothetical protein